MRYYECHITLKDSLPRDYVRQQVEEFNWKFSAIDGDPILGNETFCYATRHYPESKPKDEVIKDMNDMAVRLAKDEIEVVREKVELVIYDTKVRN